MSSLAAGQGLLGPRRIQDLLNDALRHSDADEVELAFSAETEALTRFAHNAIHQNVVETDAVLEVRAAVGTRVGLASTNDLSPIGIERAVRQAGEIARHLPENPEWPGLPGPQPQADAEPAFDEATAGATPELRAGWVAETCAAARGAGLRASGAFSTGRSEYAVLNSRGLFAYAPRTGVDFTLVCEAAGAGGSGYAHATGWRLGQVNLPGLTQEAIHRAQADARARTIAPGEYPVVLEPYAVLTLVEAMIEDGMGALAVQEGRSWMNHNLGVRCMSPAITLEDDALDPDGSPQFFDCEGVPKQRVPIVVAGVPTSPVYDRLTAAREPGRVSTGHAQPFEDEDWDGPLPENLSLAPGDQTVEQMIRAVAGGLYITRFWYVRQTAARGAAATGTTRDGVWWIEGGELAYPVQNLRFDQELIAALGRVRGVGRQRRTLAGLYGAHRLPALAIDGFRFVGAGESDQPAPRSTAGG